MLEFHPLANLFPLVEGRDFDELVEDVRAHGLLEQILIHESKILDGRNRYRAAVESGLFDPNATIEELTEKFPTSVHFEFFSDLEADGADALTWVLSKNLYRRHLSESQRAMIAADLGKLKQGRPSEWNRAPADDEKPASLRDKAPQRTAKERADMLGISERQVQTGDFVKEHGAPEVTDAVRRGDLKVSAAAELAKLPVDEQAEILRNADPRAIARVAKEHQRVGASSRSMMASRIEPPDSLDYFPTPPWATRALVEDVLSESRLASIGLPRDDLSISTVWEPACGEGHMSGVLEEHFARVIATDVFDYSVGDARPPGWAGVLDFLDTSSVIKDMVSGEEVRWIISNAPFSGEDREDRTLEFVLRALRVAPCVAMFVRSQWANEGVERYQRLFRDNPPTLVAHFAERVNLRKGSWDPEGSTATAYSWLIWIEGADRLPTMWIPPGRRVERTHEDDVLRFTAHPVAPLMRGRAEVARVAHNHEAAGSNPAPATSSVATDEGSVATVAAAVGDGEGAAVDPAALPGTPLTAVQQDETIRAGYARRPPTPIAELMAATGLTRDQIKKRAGKLKIASRDNQKAASRELMHGINARRSKRGEATDVA